MFLLMAPGLILLLFNLCYLVCLFLELNCELLLDIGIMITYLIMCFILIGEAEDKEEEDHHLLMF